MNSLTQNTFIGIISGMIIAGLGWFFNIVILPWTRNIMYL